MKVAFTPAYGPPNVIHITEQPAPQPHTHEVLVRVHSASVTAGDRRLRSADFPGLSAVLGRLLLGITAPRYPVQGTMFAGRVVAVGAAVTRFSVGDDVFGSVDHGAYAELLKTSEDSAMATIPKGVSYEEAASVPYGAGTALYFLRDLARVQAGEKVLLLGASGGVGRFAIQIAKHLGAHVTAVCSQEAFALVKQLGADQLIDHKTQDFTANTERYDVIFDMADASSFLHSRQSLSTRGRYLTLYISARALLAMALSWLMGQQRAHFAVYLAGQEHAHELRTLLELGTIRPVIAQRFALSALPEAHAFAERGIHGEVLVSMQPKAMNPNHAEGGRVDRRTA